MRITWTSSVIFSTSLLLVSLCFHPLTAQMTDASGTAAASPGVFVQVGLEPHLTMSLGYTRAINPAGSRASLGAGAGVKFSPYLVRRGAGRLNLITTGEWISQDQWGAAATSEVYLARGRNRAGTIHGFGIEIRAAPGYYGARWSAAADVGWQGTLITHIEHSAATRETFDERYPAGTPEAGGPVDGWYGSTAHRFRIGVVGARSLSDGISIRAAAGSRFSLQSQGILLGFAHAQVPVYLETTVLIGR